MDLTPLEQRNHELTILNRIAEALNRSVQLDQTLRTTLELVTELFAMRTGWIWLQQPDGTWYLAAALNLPPALASDPQAMEGWCYCLESYDAGDMAGAANINVVTCSRLKNVLAGTGGLRYHASVPLYAHGRNIGVFNVASSDWRRLSSGDLRLLHTVGDLMSIAIERTQLHERSVELGAVEERNRLAREIHDTLAQSLTAVLLRLETADTLLDRADSREQVRRQLRLALDITRSSVDEVRRSVLDLRAAPLEGRTLPEALAELASAVGARAELTVNLETVGAFQPLPMRIEIGAYRIVQEALNNVQRHAQAHTVRIVYQATPEQLLLTVSDDGCGFDPEQRRADSFGLIGLNERARLLQGTLCVETAPGAGTRIEVRIPLDASES